MADPRAEQIKVLIRKTMIEMKKAEDGGDPTKEEIADLDQVLDKVTPPIIEAFDILTNGKFKPGA